MTTTIQAEMLTKVKELRSISKKTEELLEKSSISITNIHKKQLFDNNIKSIISAVESLLRNEPPERPILRLRKEIPDLYINIKNLKETEAGKLYSTELEQLKSLISYIEAIYKRV